jgi:hypothetical protein
MWAGADLEWFEPIQRGTEVRTEAYLKELVEHQTRFAGRAIQQIYHVDFYDSSDVLLAQGDSWCFRTERDTARVQGTKYDEARRRPPMRYDTETIEHIHELYRQEAVRGAEPRLAASVSVGDPLGTIVKGPMTVTGFIAFAQGWGGLYIRANKLAYQQLRKHPGLGIPDRFGIPDVPERVHWDSDLAALVGTPEAYDYGPERCSWLMHHLTNWMGDDGFLVSHRSQIRHHNVVGDWLTIDGRVTALSYDGDGHPLVEVAQEARNQHGDLSATGLGVIRLPG